MDNYKYPRHRIDDIVILKSMPYRQFKIYDAYLNEEWEYWLDSLGKEIIKEEEVLVNLTTSKPKATIKKKKIKVFEENSEEIRLSKLLFSNMLKVNPMYKEPNFQKWASHVDLMIRTDKRPSAMIEKVIELIFEDNFWKGQIQSTAKLREKFDSLVTRFAVSMQTEATKKEKNKPMIW